jgi:hypothetical protein
MNPTPKPTTIPRRARRLLSTVLHVTLDRITLPYRDVPAEFYYFPPF